MNDTAWNHGLVTGDKVIKKDDGLTYLVDELGELEWTDRWSKEPPTEPGWYWIYVKGYPVIVKEVCLVEGELVTHHTNGHGVASSTSVKRTDLHWQKMNVPQPPKE